MASQDSQAFHWHYAELKDHDFEIQGRALFFIFLVFGVVLFVIVFVLNARWICRYGIQDSPTTNSSSRADLRPPGRSQGQGLDPTTIRTLPISLHRTANYGCVTESECCICLGVFAEGDKIKVLPRCHHRFHSECVDRWLTSKPNCPLCRDSLTIESAHVSTVSEQTGVYDNF